MCWSPTRELKNESRSAIGGDKPTNGYARGVVNPNQPATYNYDKNQQQRLDRLDRKQSHVEKLCREGRCDVRIAITNPKPRGPSMTTTNHEATDTTASDESPHTEHSHI